MNTEKMIRKARRLLERATGLWAPNNITVLWVDDLPDGVDGRFNPDRREIQISSTARDRVRVLLHEFAHAVHWDATQFAGVSRAEVEQFAVSAVFLTDLVCVGRLLVRYEKSKRNRLYYQAQCWFERQLPSQVKAWMDYVLCF